jgi:hypothetical protein
MPEYGIGVPFDQNRVGQLTQLLGEPEQKIFCLAGWVCFRAVEKYPFLALEQLDSQALAGNRQLDVVLHEIEFGHLLQNVLQLVFEVVHVVLLQGSDSRRWRPLNSPPFFRCQSGPDRSCPLPFGPSRLC